MKTLPPVFGLVLSLAATAILPAQVPFERIRDAANEPGNWLTYSGNYAGQRNSPLAEITSANVANLKAAWVYQCRDAGAKLECSPLVIDGVLYITERPNVVTALDGRTGRPIWNYRRPMATDVSSCCGPVNRGLAVLGDLLFLATFDCHLVALDLQTGKERWDVVVADYKTGHSITAAPLAVKGRIVVGISGGEFGVRGFLDAYEPGTGARAWRFWTIPAPGEPGHETWGSGDAWEHGGAPTWVTGSYDPALNLLYWGTGNPGPDYNGDARPGDNLYSCSVIALDPDTGKLRWHFQYTPHDLHDWDSNQTPILFDAEIAGKSRQLLGQANRNGFYYVLDRATGEFIAGAPYIKQTWASGLDAKGKPILIPGAEPTTEGVLVYPGLTGATNWYAPAFSPTQQLFYVQALEDYAQVFFKLKADYEPGGNFEGGSTRGVAGQESHATIKALEATSGKLRWEFKLNSSANCGVMSTAGGLVFGGSREGDFFALDAAKGTPLWHFQTGGAINANPVSFLVDGKQHVAIAAGSAIFVFAR